MMKSSDLRMILLDSPDVLGGQAATSSRTLPTGSLAPPDPRDSRLDICRVQSPVGFQCRPAPLPRNSRRLDEELFLTRQKLHLSAVSMFLINTESAHSCRFRHMFCLNSYPDTPWHCHTPPHGPPWHHPNLITNMPYSYMECLGVIGW